MFRILSLQPVQTSTPQKWRHCVGSLLKCPNNVCGKVAPAGASQPPISPGRLGMWPHPRPSEGPGPADSEVLMEPAPTMPTKGKGFKRVTHKMSTGTQFPAEAIQIPECPLYKGPWEPRGEEAMALCRSPGSARETHMSAIDLGQGLRWTSAAGL